MNSLERDVTLDAHMQDEPNPFCKVQLLDRRVVNTYLELTSKPQ